MVFTLFIRNGTEYPCAAHLFLWTKFALHHSVLNIQVANSSIASTSYYFLSFEYSFGRLNACAWRHACHGTLYTGKTACYTGDTPLPALREARGGCQVLAQHLGMANSSAWLSAMQSLIIWPSLSSGHLSLILNLNVVLVHLDRIDLFAELQACVQLYGDHVF